jgi:hypothetical protein
MRLPTDATLLLGEAADPALAQVWREERLPVVDAGVDLEDLPTATLVVCEPEAAARAAALGFRTFVVGETAPEGARAVSLAETLEAARAARARERWKAARASGG